jgi:hypothetical protein
MFSFLVAGIGNTRWLREVLRRFFLYSLRAIPTGAAFQGFEKHNARYTMSGIALQSIIPVPIKTLDELH